MLLQVELLISRLLIPVKTGLGFLRYDLASCGPHGIILHVRSGHSFLFGCFRFVEFLEFFVCRTRASVNVSFLRFSLYDVNGFSFLSFPFASRGGGYCAEQKR